MTPFLSNGLGDAFWTTGPFRQIWPRPERHPLLTVNGEDGRPWRPIPTLGDWDFDTVEVLLDPSDSTVWWRPIPKPKPYGFPLTQEDLEATAGWPNL